MAALLVIWIAFAGLGGFIASQKRRGVPEGVILGFLFGPIGCIIEALLPTKP